MESDDDSDRYLLKFAESRKKVVRKKNGFSLRLGHRVRTSCPHGRLLLRSAFDIREYRQRPPAWYPDGLSRNRNITPSGTVKNSQRARRLLKTAIGCYRRGVRRRGSEKSKKLEVALVCGRNIIAPDREPQNAGQLVFMRDILLVQMLPSPSTQCLARRKLHPLSRFRLWTRRRARWKTCLVKTHWHCSARPKCAAMCASGATRSSPLRATSSGTSASTWGTSIPVPFRAA